VKATYRIGIGAAGNARAGQISQLSTRPLGVKDVVNPLRASGGADRDSRDAVRRNAPNAVRSLDRLVSTRDYADFARSFAGIAKAAAAELSDGRRTVVHVTIAGTADVPIDPGSDLFVNLARALRDLGDPLQPVELAWRELLILMISARIRIDPAYRWEMVVTDVRARLLEAFAFERRDLGQDVTSSEVLSVMQSVRGVTYVDLEAFGAIPATTPDPLAEDGRRPSTPAEIADAVTGVIAGPLPARVPAGIARRSGNALVAAELAVLVPDVPATLILNQIM
jgi:predicted phage baseplate assembly protein